MADPASRSLPARLARYARVSTALALLSDRQLGRLVAAAPLAGTGIGGATIRLDVAGTPVFVKRVPLTELEMRPEHVRSTANIFRLPTFYHYGVGSAGCGVWRELAAHILTTNWVLGAQSESFPLLYHWRVLAGRPPQPAFADPAELERQVAYWDGSPAVRARLQALAGASASVVLFLEHFPQNLAEWLAVQAGHGAGATAAACALVERSLRADIAFMTSNRLLHFDAHFGNIVTDGERLYLSDFGLAASSAFDLSAAELAFVESNLSHDQCYAVTELLNWLVTVLTDPAGPAARNAFIRRCADVGVPATLPGWAARVIERYAPIAVVMNEFYWRLHGDRRTTAYPLGDIHRACAAAGFELAVARSAGTPGGQPPAA
jgi:hypothetical protein